LTPTVERRAFEIAANARRYRLIARRPEYLLDRETRIRHALAEDAQPLHLFDAAMAIGASELDIFCGYVVSILNKPHGRPTTTLLDALGILEPDRVAAIYFALAPERRNVMLRDGPCAIHIQRVAREIPDAERRLNEFIADTPTSPIGYALARLDIELEDELATMHAR
jgi:hypothetical protein